MRTAGMTVALAVCWLAGVVGAASLPPDDQYSPQQSPYKRDAARGPRGYPNWLEYHQAPSTGFEPPENNPGMTSVQVGDLSRERKSPKDSIIRDLDFLSLTPGGWNEATTRVMRNSTEPHSDIDVPEEGLEILTASHEDPFDADDTFQDQGPGSVEVYKLDLRRENSLLVPQAKRNQPPVAFRIKSKLPKKAKGDEILWKLKPIEASKTSLPAIFREPPSIYRGETIPPESMRKIEEVRKEEVFTVGGVPELQVGCEGLEASDRKRRSSGPGEEDSDDEYKPKFKDPVYRESTEPILLRVTPIVLDFEDEPPSGQIYEELDELLKLKSSTTPEPTTKRTNRGDIDPALENYEHEDTPIDEMLPERGDLGSNGSKGNARVQRSIRPEDSQGSKVEDVRFPREANREVSPSATGVSGQDDDTLSPIIGSQSLNNRGGRKLLWVQYPERHESQAGTRHHQGIDENQDPDLWGFGEDDGEKLDDAVESNADQMRRVEEEKRRREYERRRQEDLNRRHGERERHPHSQEHPSKAERVHSEIEKIRKEYERLQEKEQRERQRSEEEKRREGDRRQWEYEQRKIEEAKRRQTDESQRRMEEEERKHRDPSHSRRREEEERRRDWIRRREEEERRIRLENERNNQAPPAALTRPSPYEHPDNRSRNHQEEERREIEERKLREYIERNRPINVKKSDGPQRPEDQTRRRYEDEERRKHIEAQRRRMEEQQRRLQSPNETEWRRQHEEQERRRQMEEQQRRHQSPNETEWRRQHEEQERRRQMEEQQRRHQSPNETEWRRQHEERERRRQMEEQQRRHQDEAERRRLMEEQERRDRPDHDRQKEEERRRLLEEERKLQEYVRRNQPVNVPMRNSSQESNWQEQRRILNEARRWDQHKAQKDGRSHGPAAPTNIGPRRSQEDLEELRRRQEAERLEDERRRFMEEGRKREEEYRRQESRRHEEERQRLLDQRRREEANRRRPNWQDSRRPANTTQRGDEVRDRDPGELRRHETSQRVPSNSRRNQEDEWRRTQERERQRQQQHEERERQRMEQERNDRNNRRRRPQHEDTRPSEQRQRGESVRNQEETERRRREEARLNALPVSARIMIHTDEAASRNDRTLPTAPPVPPVISIGSRDGFGNEIDFPAISPNRPGLAAHRFPAPATQKPPTKSPGPCVWAIISCCPANNRLTTCFESMGCPGVNWDPNPCRASIQSAARAQVLSFYETAEDNYSRG